MEYDHKKLPFLDILLYKNAERLESDIHYKQLDTHQYLDYHSCHLGHTKSNIPYTLARRICAIVTNQDLKNKKSRFHSGEYDVCDVTLSVYPHRASLKNMPGHGGNRTYDIYNINETKNGQISQCRKSAQYHLIT